MESAENPIRYSYTVKNNHPAVLQTKKKAKILNATLCLICSAIFGCFLGLASLQNNPQTVAIVILACFTAFALICAIYFYATIKESQKDRTRSRDLIFYEHSFALVEHDEIKNKDKNLSKCLYARHANKQYIAKFTETKDKFEIKILTGTYNGMPQYKKFVLPKDLIPVEKAEEFKSFMQAKVGNNYQIKIS